MNKILNYNYLLKNHQHLLVIKMIFQNGIFKLQMLQLYNNHFFNLKPLHKIDNKKNLRYKKENLKDYFKN